MQSQQIGNYIAEQLRAGHSETALRQHLLQHGWTQVAVDEAFGQYYRTDVTDIPQAPVRRHKTYRAKWTTRARRLKLVVASMVFVAFAAGGTTIYLRSQAPVDSVAAGPVSHQAKQAMDVATIAGAVVQYVVVSGSLPTVASVELDGNLLLCTTNCDPTVPGVAPLQAYKASNVHIMAHAAGLTAPNKDVMYLVPQAECNNKTEIGKASTNPRAMVLLYARVTDKGTVPRCITM